MKYGTLDLLNERQMQYLPPHFVTLQLDDNVALSYKEQITNWIRTKLQGRYALLKSIGLNSDQKMKASLIVGFEKPNELTYFIIACPFLRRT
jgi:hypothetical protein